jgi:hypothetical protein
LRMDGKKKLGMNALAKKLKTMRTVKPSLNSQDRSEPSSDLMVGEWLLYYICPAPIVTFRQTQ